MMGTYLDEFFGINPLLDFFNGRFFHNRKKSYRDLLIERLNNPEVINGVFTFNFTGSAEVTTYISPPGVHNCQKYIFAYRDSSDQDHRANIYSNGQNTDVTITNCIPNSLNIFLNDGGHDIMYPDYVIASADFHLMWVFTPASPSSL